MIKYRGEHSMKVFVINKPIKSKQLFFSIKIIWKIAGFRAFLLCESSSGFVLNWLLDRSSAVVITILFFYFFLFFFIFLFFWNRWKMNKSNISNLLFKFANAYCVDMKIRDTLFSWIDFIQVLNYSVNWKR